MPYDPNWPQSGDTLTGVLLRGQWNGLHDELEQQIAAIPAGPAGPAGRDGRDGVDGAPGGQGPAGPPGADSTVPGPEGPEGRHVVGVDDNQQGQAIIHMSDGALYGPFTVASGPQGIQGPPGPNLNMRGDWLAWEVYNRGDVIAYNGNVYVAFADGLSGPPPDGDPRWKLLTLTGPAGAPGSQGERGDKGDKGDTGEPGSAGPAGPPGEVTAAQLAQEISFAFGGTSANSNTVQPLDTNADLPTAIAKLNELITALRR